MLLATKVEVRTELDEDVRAHAPLKEIRQEIVQSNEDLGAICDMLRRIVSPVVARLAQKQVLMRVEVAWSIRQAHTETRTHSKTFAITYRKSF